MNYSPQLMAPKLSQTGSYLETPEMNRKIRLKVQKEHFTKRHWRRKIQKQYREQFIQFLNQILKDALRHQHHEITIVH